MLVTGAAGFVGNHLVDALVDHNTVIALDHFRTNSPDQLPDDVTVIEGDIRNETALRRATEGVDVIFHQAAARGALASIEDPVETQTVNVDGTLALLEAAREVDARVIVASSAAVYGEPADLPVHETDSKEPTSPYGVQKLTVDHYARLWNDLYDLETVVLRYFNIYGQRASDTTFRGIVGTFIKQARDGELTILGDGSQTRDLVHVSDIVQANLHAATTEHTGYAYNIGSGTSTSINDLAHFVREHVNPAAEFTYATERQWDIQDSRADLTRARTLLNYEPTVTHESYLENREPGA